MRCIFIFFLAICSCTSEPETKVKDVNWTKHNSTDLNKNLAIQEGIDIQLFLEMHKDWSMTKTGESGRIGIRNDVDGWNSL